MINRGNDMNSKDLNKLSRRDLLAMLIEQSEELLLVKEKLKKLELELDDREINIDKAGSIAEAALQLNGVFEAAEEAGKQYLDNIKLLSERQEKICARLEKEGMEIASKRIEEAKKTCAAMETETKVKCTEMVAKSKAEVKAYWDEVSLKLEKFYQDHAGLKELLSKATVERRQE